MCGSAATPIADTRRFIEYAVRTGGIARSQRIGSGRAYQDTTHADVRAILASVDARRTRAVRRRTGVHPSRHGSGAEPARRRCRRAVPSRRARQVWASRSTNCASSLPIDRPVLDHVLAQMKADGRLSERHALWASAGPRCGVFGRGCRRISKPSTGCFGKPSIGRPASKRSGTRQGSSSPTCNDW